MEEGWVRAGRKYELNFLLRMDYLETSYDSVHHDEVSICGCKRSCKSGDGNLLLPNGWRLACPLKILPLFSPVVECSIPGDYNR
jgi:hypothetical protein